MTKEADRLYQARKRDAIKADPEAYAAYLARERARGMATRAAKQRLTWEEYKAKMAGEKAARDAVKAADREAARWQREYRRKEKLRLEIERAAAAAEKAGREAIDRERERQYREEQRRKRYDAHNARRRGMIATTGPTDNPRIRAMQMLGSSVSLTEDKEVLEWRWSDMTCPRCVKSQRLVRDGRYVWCKECAYELKEMTA